ncbi:MAG: hypothetical protein ACFFE8_03785 [Candidatus Heimdallarchaeota archaeon]
MDIGFLSILQQRYPQTADAIIDAIDKCDQLTELITSEDFSQKDFYVNLLQNIRLFLNSESMFHSRSFQKALKFYEKLRASISETQTQFPDSYSSWRYDIDRLTSRTEARLQEARAQLSLEQEDTVQADILLVETINRYNLELQLEQEYGDYDHYFDTLGNIFRCSGHLYFLRGRTNNNRIELYQSMKDFRKAIFLGQLDLDGYVKEAHKNIKIMTLAKLEQQAENYFNLGLTETDAEKYSEAKRNYHKSAQLFTSLKRAAFQPDQSREFELQEQIQFSSYYEASAKEFMTQDNNEQAAVQFSNASRTLRNVLESLPSEALSRNFSPQIDYFEAMRLFCLAVIEYDKMLPEAMIRFKTAREKLETARQQAEGMSNLPLVNNCEETLNKLKSYIEIAELLHSEESKETLGVPNIEDPVQPMEPAQPSELEEPELPPAEPELPLEPEEPAQPFELEEPELPPAELELPLEPEEPAQPFELEEPELPPAEPELPLEPEEPAQPFELEEPELPPAELELPLEPEEPAQPFELEEPELPPAEPELPLEPEEPARPSELEEPEPPKKPVKPHQLEETIKPLEVKKPKEHEVFQKQTKHVSDEWTTEPLDLDPREILMELRGRLDAEKPTEPKPEDSTEVLEKPKKSREEKNSVENGNPEKAAEPEESEES